MRKNGEGVITMTIDKRFLLKLDLQNHADEIDQDEIDVEDTDTTNGEAELFEALRSMQEQEDSEDDTEFEDEEDSEDEEDEFEDDEEEYEDEEDFEDEDDEDDSDDEEYEEETPAKKVQSKEENAKFAAQRRQQEIDRQVQARLDELKEQSPEFKLAQSLSKRFGKPVEEIMAEMDEAALVEEAEESKIPIERLRKEKAAEEKANRLEAEVNQLKFQNWQTQIKADGEKLKSEYPMLSYDELDQAVDYILHTAKNVDMPLEEAVYALHGKKIVQSLANSKVQEDLANQSGRSKKTPLSVRNGKSSQTNTLTAEETYIAKQFGMSADDYIKYRG